MNPLLLMMPTSWSRQPQAPQKWQCSAQRQPQSGEDSCQGVVLELQPLSGVGYWRSSHEKPHHPYFMVNKQVLMAT